MSTICGGAAILYRNLLQNNASASPSMSRALQGLWSGGMDSKAASLPLYFPLSEHLPAYTIALCQCQRLGQPCRF